MKNSTLETSKSSPPSTPPKKKSKKEEVSVLFSSLSCKFTFLLQIVYMFQFEDVVANHGRDPTFLAAKALSIITHLEDKNVSRVIYSQYL